MKKIGIISDTHGTFDEKLRTFLADVDEIWCAGDIGGDAVAQQIAAFKPLRAVHGNIDDHIVRLSYKEFIHFRVEGVSVLMTHIGMQYGKYITRAYAEIAKLRPTIFICGHSHILKVFYDKKFDLLNINPGAAGVNGFHKVRTAIRLEIDGDKLQNMEVGEWDR